MDDGALALEKVPDVPIERSRDGSHGDYATPVAMGLARQARRNPREIAELIVSRLADSPEIAAVEVAGPGFINFTIAEAARASLVDQILAAGEAFGRSARGRDRLHVVRLRQHLAVQSLHPVGRNRARRPDNAL